VVPVQILRYLTDELKEELVSGRKMGSTLADGMSMLQKILHDNLGIEHGQNPL
jgi:hypothetical protein